MNIAILGTGTVGQIIGNKLLAMGHTVTMGSRTTSNENLTSWVAKGGSNAMGNTFNEAARSADTFIFNCTAGVHSLDALATIDAQNVNGKIIIDVANSLDFSNGMPPSLLYCNKTSLGEKIQDAFPEARVVKALNTVNCDIMIDADRINGEHKLFMAGNDKIAKDRVIEDILNPFGWEGNVIDLGGIEAARSTEMLLPLWINLMNYTGTAHFNFNIVQ